MPKDLFSLFIEKNLCWDRPDFKPGSLILVNPYIYENNIGLSFIT